MMRPLTRPGAVLAFVLGVVLVAPAACVRIVPLDTPAGWIRDDSLAGVSVFRPTAWRLTSNGRSGRIELSGPDGARAIVWPFFVGGSLSGPNAAAVASALAKAALPAVRWGRPAESGLSAVRLAGSTPRERAVGVVTWTRTREGTAGSLDLASAPPRSYLELRSTFSAIFRSIRLFGEAQAPADSQYVAWRDPTEGAFSLEIPKGWTATGGVIRPRGNERFLYSEVKLLSPDGSIVIYMGDGFPSFSEPNANRPAGSTYQLGGRFYYVERYLPGAQFLLNFALPQVAPRFHVLSERDRPDLADVLLKRAVSRYDAGEVEYRFESKGETYRGAGLCITEERPAPAGATDWNVWRLLLFQGPASRYREAAAAAVHLAASFRVDPAWIAANLDMLGQTGHNIAGNGAALATVVSRGSWAREAEDPMLLRRQAATVNVRDVVDHETGERFEVETSDTYYWVDERGLIAGTETEAAAGLNFAPLL